MIGQNGGDYAVAVSYKKNETTKKWSVRVWWIDAAGKRCSKQKRGFVTKKAAQLWAGSETDSGQESLYENAHKLKFGIFLDEWLKIKENKLSPTTISGYKVNVNKIKNALGNVLVQELRLDIIQNFINEQMNVIVNKKLVSKPEVQHVKVASNTVKYTYRTLHSALSYAVKVGIIKFNPADYVDLPPEQKFNPTTLDVNDVVELISALKKCEHELYLPVLLSVMHGLRRGEALGLRWSDIDFDAGTICIQNNYTVAGNKFIHKSVKTKDSAATIPLNDFVSGELLNVRNNQIANGCQETYVCALEGNLPDPRHISEMLNRFQRANNLKVCRFHDLRHSFAGIALDSGTDLDTLKRLMRHSKISMTSRYLHNNVSRERKAADKIESKFSEALKGKSV